MAPVASPLHVTGVTTEVIAIPDAGSVIVVFVVAVHPFASVTTTLYAPATKFCGSCSDVLLDH